MSGIPILETYTAANEGKDPIVYNADKKLKVSCTQSGATGFDDINDVETNLCAKKYRNDSVSRTTPTSTHYQNIFMLGKFAK
ncbi:uncharacterized protein PHALS_06838 [Plasmopara halstedii]|uniref:Uncharacterized protein n=1 Tax=Plasmopara halstedii TaxID=4781 RepID=A0A0P1B2U7_PLAHL|nr:uncharacterized protein PHALS_06838 [Plasmopara halstedii]CEG49050.1 hypothetical protein PHALS_06838 [Plasmopara halstedii]|eukprot:XP_024585419.1 hypothetical protein PHALS_06838 [Plasmopara halstedii]